MYLLANRRVMTNNFERQITKANVPLMAKFPKAAGARCGPVPMGHTTS